MTTDGEQDRQLKRKMEAMEAQDLAVQEIRDELKQERDDLVAEFDKDTDLKSKILIDGVKKVSVLGVIKYH